LSERSEFDAGRKEMEVEARIDAHDTHLQAINGNIERTAGAMLEMAAAIRELAEESRQARNTAAVLAQETERRRVELADAVSTSGQRFTNRQQLAGLFLTLTGLVVAAYLGTH
jgi:methyl-accepting chemotaxis protein